LAIWVTPNPLLSDSALEKSQRTREQPNQSESIGCGRDVGSKPETLNRRITSWGKAKTVRTEARAKLERFNQTESALADGVKRRLVSRQKDMITAEED
jgi:hypothetical protein